MQIIHASVSDRILSKADRLFTNRLSQILAELLQNSRRAEATRVEVTAAEENGRTTIVFHDNGRGIEDFSTLLHLGHSGWETSTEVREDPAGMGFFALLYSGVDVTSGNRTATITKAQFLGEQSVEVMECEPAMPGTRLTFVRNQDLETVKRELASVVRFGSIDVVVNGELLPREDFLKDAVRIKTVDGVRIGVFHGSDYRLRANFHGHVIEIRKPELRMEQVLLQDERVYHNAAGLHVDFDILETRKLRLKLPDRTDVVEDDFFGQLVLEARIAMFEYLAEQTEHCARYALWEEARQLGVNLKEAVPWLQPFYEPAKESGERLTQGGMFRETFDPATCALVEVYENDSFTFDVALAHFRKAPLTPLSKDPAYAGYSWYRVLPVYRDFSLTIDGHPAGEITSAHILTVVDSIRLSFSLVTPDKGDGKGETVESFAWDLPFAGWCDDDYEPALFITRDSEWAQKSDPYTGPFSLPDGAMHVAFIASDDADSDSYDTQRDYFVESVSSALRRVLGGPVAQARYLLKKAVGDWNLRQALLQAAISEVRLFRDPAGEEWQFELKLAA